MKKWTFSLLAVLTACTLLLSGCSSEKEVFIEGTPVSEAAKEQAAAKADETSGTSSAIAAASSVEVEEISAAAASSVAEEPAACSEAEPAKMPAVESSKKVLLAVSFGTSYNATRNITIGGIENALREAFPEYEVRRAFTATSVIQTLEERDGILVDDVKTAIEKCADEGVQELVILPTQLTGGYDYQFIQETAEGYAEAFDRLSVAGPLLGDENDLAAVAEALAAKTAEYDDGSTAIVFVGEGSEARANTVYGELQEALTFLGHENCYIGTLSAEPSLEDVLEACKDKGYTRVILEDLMVVAGDHAYTEMAGDGPDTWETAFRNAGYDVTCIMDGLGQIYDIQRIYVRHAAAAGGMDIPSWAAE